MTRMASCLIAMLTLVGALGVCGCRSAEGQGGLLGGGGQTAPPDGATGLQGTPADRAPDVVAIAPIDSLESLTAALDQMGLPPLEKELTALVTGSLWELGGEERAVGFSVTMGSDADAALLAAAVEGSAAWLGASGASPVLIAATGPDPAATSLLCRLRAEVPLNPPLQAAGWALEGEPQRFDTETIFSLIDGAAETHLRYNMLTMVRGTYSLGADLAAHVDVFAMQSAEDAYGLLSRLGRGEPMQVGQAALGGGRAISVWQGPFFVAVTAATRQRGDIPELADLARAVVETLGPEGPRPPLVERLAVLCGDIRRVRAFHERMDQENFYYLSTGNVLCLDAGTDGLMLHLSGDPEGPVGLVVRYPTADAAEAARDSLAELLAASSGAAEGPWPWEKGTVADLRLSEEAPHLLFAVFAAPSPEDAERWLATLMEGSP